MSGLFLMFWGLNQYEAADKLSCSRTQDSDSAGSESRTSKPLIPSTKLYQLSHCAAARQFMLIAQYMFNQVKSLHDQKVGLLRVSEYSDIHGSDKRIENKYLPLPKSLERASINFQIQEVQTSNL